MPSSFVLRSAFFLDRVRDRVVDFNKRKKFSVVEEAAYKQVYNVYRPHKYALIQPFEVSWINNVNLQGEIWQMLRTIH